MKGFSLPNVVKFKSLQEARSVISPPDFKSDVKCFVLKVRGRLEEDPAFAAVTVESERIRLFNEHVSSLEVGIQFCPERFFHILRSIIVVLNMNNCPYYRSALLFLPTAILTSAPFLSFLSFRSFYLHYRLTHILLYLYFRRVRTIIQNHTRKQRRPRNTGKDQDPAHPVG